MTDTIASLTQFIQLQLEKRANEKPNLSTQLRQSYTPDQLLEKLDIKIPLEQKKPAEILEIVQRILDESVVTNHPYFMNQMYGKTQPIAFLADVLISLLNTSMYTYEVAPVLTLLEKETITFLASKVWEDGIGDGVFTAGGSMSNMKALFLARQNKHSTVKNTGLFHTSQVSIFISEQAHYSFVKGVNFMGFGTDALVKIPTDADARIQLEHLETAIDKSIQAGRLPLMLVGIAGTTISGTFDDLVALAKIAKKHQMWFHVDACYGGALLFSEKEKSKLIGIKHADSVSWNFHKVMGMPLSTATFLTKEKGALNKAFNANANYLFHESDYDYDLGQKSLQGGRRPDVLKLWLSLKYQGANGFSDIVDKLRNTTQKIASKIQSHPKFELFQKPESTIVCFRYLPKDNSLEAINKFNIQLREQIFKDGKIIFNYAPIHEKIYLRMVFLDPDFTENQLDYILETLITHAEKMES